ncbi:MAG TPA: LapA family protein [Thermomicrobiales bacterium]|nr:LapA family protein [Thermomicrobiales bacterium]
MPRIAWTPKLIAALILLVLALILLLQNWGHVYVYLLLWEFRIRLVWALLGTFLLGALLGWMVPNLREEATRLRTRWRRR